MLNRIIRYKWIAWLPSYFYTVAVVAGASGTNVVSEGLDDGVTAVRDEGSRPSRHCRAA